MLSSTRHRRCKLRLLEYPNRTLCRMHISCAQPAQEGRTLVVVGKRRWRSGTTPSRWKRFGFMIKDSCRSRFTIRLGSFKLVLRNPDILIPKLPSEEPLKVQAQAFFGVRAHRQRPLADGAFPAMWCWRWKPCAALTTAVAANGGRKLTVATTDIRGLAAIEHIHSCLDFFLDTAFHCTYHRLSSYRYSSHS